jgi:MerC mercury resistance protein
MLYYNKTMLSETPNAFETQSPENVGDGLAVGLSVLCLAHCLLLPVLAGAVPLLGALTHAPWVHAVLLLLAAPLSVWVLVKGYRHHKRVLPLLVGIAGLALLATGLAHATHLASERTASVAGAVILLLAHGHNFWLRWRKQP